MKKNEKEKLYEKVITLQNYNRVIYRKLKNYENTIERYKKITNKLKEENRYLKKKVRKYEESNNSRKNRK